MKENPFDRIYISCLVIYVNFKNFSRTLILGFANILLKCDAEDQQLYYREFRMFQMFLFEFYMYFVFVIVEELVANI